MNKHVYKSAMGKIKASDELKKSMIENIDKKDGLIKLRKRSMFLKTLVATAAVFAIVAGMIVFYPKIKKLDSDIPNIQNPSDGIYISKIELPKNTKGVMMDMIGLIVYNGRIYTQTSTSISAESAKELLGDKLGTTKGNIDEWSNQDEYTVEFASTIGKEDVYTVKGYDTDFRLMTYTKYDDGNVYPQFYECLNGLTVKSGQDVLGKLKIDGNIKSGEYKSFNDWNNGIENYQKINNIDLLNSFARELNEATPYLYESIASTLESYRNNEGYREIIFTLNDGCKTSLRVYGNGYIGYSNLYFKMENQVFGEFWDELSL